MISIRTAVLALVLLDIPLRADFSLVSGVSIPGGGRVVSHYDAPQGPDLILATRSVRAPDFATHGIEIFTLDSDGALTQVGTVSLSPIFGAADTRLVSSVAADPLGRGFGVATVIPEDNTRVRGKLVFFDLPNESVLRVIDVGFHPESVVFTPDGNRIIVANEGEFAADRPHAPGSISVFTLPPHTTAASLFANPPPVATIDFRSALAFGVTLDALRINVPEAPAAERYLHVEPESISATNEKAYVTLQENNAIAVIDLTGANANRVTAILPLGRILQLIDPGDQDSDNRVPGSASGMEIAHRAVGLPMPGSIATFVAGGRRLLATANEGEPRPDEGDIARVGLGAYYDLRRLFVSRVDPMPTMLGTRSFSLWDEAGNRVFDSGSMIEAFVRVNAPWTFNMDQGSTAYFDTRSDDRGPEPSTLAFGEIEGRRYLFLGAERQNGIFQFDITDLDRVEIVGYFNAVDGVSVTTGKRFVTPETMAFVPADRSPIGRPLVIVGYEGVAGLIDGSIAVFEIVPKSGGLVNGSFLAPVTAGDTLIMGFAIEGAENVLLRAVGPGLQAGFNVAGVLEDPRLDLLRESTLIASNDDWGGNGALTIAANAVGAFPLPPASRDAAILRAITGTHSVHLVARTSGRALLEAYGVGPGSRFSNLSALGTLRDRGDALIGGFVIGGAGVKTVLIRAVGGELRQFGIASPLGDPRFVAFGGAVRLASNNYWRNQETEIDARVTEADFAAAGAFTLRDFGSAALRLSLIPGAYTVHAEFPGRAQSGNSLSLLLEIYEIR